MKYAIRKLLTNGLCYGCKTISLGGINEISQTDDQGDFFVKMCDLCVIKAVKRFVVTLMDDEIAR